MNIITGLLIIAIGAFCQSSSYVPINKIRRWSWESYWLVQGVFAWLIFPFLGAMLAVPAGHGLMELYGSAPKETLLTMFFGVLWGVGGLTFGLSMRYLGVALGQGRPGRVRRRPRRRRPRRVRRPGLLRAVRPGAF
jgi:L-rhamnose-H+ transport protein